MYNNLYLISVDYTYEFVFRDIKNGSDEIFSIMIFPWETDQEVPVTGWPRFLKFLFTCNLPAPTITGVRWADTRSCAVRSIFSRL